MLSREALAAALAQVQGEEIEYQPGYWVWQMEVEIRDLFVARLRERLAQLPEKCGTCAGSGIYDWSDYREPGPCPSCHGKGSLYPPALVERIAKAIAQQHGRQVADNFRGDAVAVLDALNTEPALDRNTKGTW